MHEVVRHPLLLLNTLLKALIHTLYARTHHLPNTIVQCHVHSM